jgi:hypothetical protein
VTLAVVTVDSLQPGSDELIEIAARTHPSGGPQGPDARHRWIGGLALIVVAALPVVEAVRIVVQHQSVVLDGDEALLALGARRAGDFLQLVGPYSRVGFHQPGPAVFYLLAPFVRLLGPGGAGLFLGAIAISGAALIATVAFLWRLIGPVAALWAAVVIDLYCLCLQVGTLREPWNPYLVVTPMVLFVVLWAAGITGAPGAMPWALIIGSCEIQTHIATAGFVVIMAAVLVGRAVVSAWRGKGDRSLGRRGWAPSRSVPMAVLPLMWVPSTVELWRDHPNNVRLLWDYFTAAHALPTVPHALDVTAYALTIMPFGYHDYVLTSSRSPAQLALGGLLLVVGLVVAVTLGLRRHQPLALALAATAVLGILLGGLSLVLSADPLYLYFAVWLAFVPLSLLLSIGISLFGPAREPVHSRLDGYRRPSRRPPTRPWLVGAAVAIVSVVAVTVHSDLRMAPISTSTGAGPWPLPIDTGLQARARAAQDTAALTAAAEEVLRPSDRRVNFDISATSPWPYIAGMVLALDQRGVSSTVTPAAWTLYFGADQTPSRPVTVEFEITSSSVPPSQRPEAATTATVIDGYVLTYQRTAG